MSDVAPVFVHVSCAIIFHCSCFYSNGRDMLISFSSASSSYSFHNSETQRADLMTREKKSSLTTRRRFCPCRKITSFNRYVFFLYSDVTNKMRGPRLFSRRWNSIESCWWFFSFDQFCASLRFCRACPVFVGFRQKLLGFFFYRLTRSGIEESSVGNSESIKEKQNTENDSKKKTSSNLELLRIR